MRQIQVIGEAASCISVEFQSEHPKLQWSNMIGISQKDHSWKHQRQPCQCLERHSRRSASPQTSHQETFVG